MRLPFSSLVSICLVKYIFAYNTQPEAVSVEREEKASLIRSELKNNQDDSKRDLQAYDVVQIADLSYDEPTGDYHDTEHYHHETTIPKYHQVHASKEVEDHPVVAVHISKEEHYDHIPAKGEHVLHSEKIEENHPKHRKGKHYGHIHRHHKKKGSHTKAKGKQTPHAKDTYVVAPHYHHHTHINVNEPEEEEDVEEEGEEHHHKHFRGRYHLHKGKGKRNNAYYKSTDDDVHVPKKKGRRHKYQVDHYTHSDDFMTGFRAGYHYGRYFGKLHGEYEYKH